MNKLYSFIAACAIGSLAFAQAPTLVVDLQPGTDSSSPSRFTVLGTDLLFTADDDSGSLTAGVDNGREWYKTDGTAANTSFVADIRPGSSSSSPFNTFTYNGNLYFTANDGGGAELWTTDGTAAGTTKVDLFPAIAGEVPNNGTVLGTTVFMTTNQGGNNNQLTEWDGTTAMISPDMTNPAPITLVSAMTAWNNLLYLYMENTTDEPTTGRELYTYDPATDTYTLIKDIAAGNANSGISNFTDGGAKLYFEAVGNLYETDGTAAGTVEVPAAATLTIGGVNNLFAHNGILYFEGDAGSNDQLFALDMTAGTITQLSMNQLTTMTLLILPCLTMWCTTAVEMM
jgi:hypothetical protein